MKFLLGYNIKIVFWTVDKNSMGMSTGGNFPGWRSEKMLRQWEDSLLPSKENLGLW